MAPQELDPRVCESQAESLCRGELLTARREPAGVTVLDGVEPQGACEDPGCLGRLGGGVEVDGDSPLPEGFKVRGETIAFLVSDLPGRPLTGEAIAPVAERAPARWRQRPRRGGG